MIKDNHSGVGVIVIAPFRFMSNCLIGMPP
jgi:hypothetical protein